MSEKVSILTLRLTAEEAAQMEVLKSITGKKSGSEAIQYIVKEYPRFCAHSKQEARELSLIHILFRFGSLFFLIGVCFYSNFSFYGYFFS